MSDTILHDTHAQTLASVMTGPKGAKLKVEVELKVWLRIIQFHNLSHTLTVPLSKVIRQTELHLIEGGFSKMRGRAAFAPIAMGGYADIFKARMNEGDREGKLVRIRLTLAATMVSTYTVAIRS